MGISEEEPPIVQGITTHLLDRLEDTTRHFNRALLLGNYPYSVLKRLSDYRVGVKEVYFVDASPVIREKIKSTKYPGLEVHVVDGDDENIPVDKKSVDLVVHHLGLHWVNDLQSCLRQCCQVLKPDGMFLGSMIGGTSLTELRQCLSFAEQERHGGVSPRLSPLVQVSDAGRLLTDAGLNLNSVDVDNIIMKYRNAWDLVHDLRTMGESNACLQRQNTLDLDTALAMSAIYSEKYSDPDEWISASIQAIYMIGWSPSPGHRNAEADSSIGGSLEDLESLMDVDFKPVPTNSTEDK